MSQQTAHSLPTFNQMYEFLRARYKHDRFEGRNAHWPKGVPEGGSYAELVARSALADLIARGHGFIGHFEAASGRAERYEVAQVLAA